MTREDEKILERIVAKLERGEELTPAEYEHAARPDSAAALRRADALQEMLMRESSETEEETGRTIVAVRRRSAIRAAGEDLLLTVVLAASLLWLTFALTARQNVPVDILSIRVVGVLITGGGVGSAVRRLVRSRRASQRAGLASLSAVACAIVLVHQIAVSSAGVHSAYYVAAIIVMFALAALSGWIIGGGALPFKRIYGTRMVSGVLLGIAEALGWKAGWLRLAAVVLLVIAPGWTVAAYLLLDAAMQVHPEDRERMWRFRLVRWFRARGAIAV